MARPTKLTPDTQDKLTQAIRLGATYKMACQYAGIDYSTLRNWMRDAEVELNRANGNGRASVRKLLADKVALFHAIKKAEGDAVVGWLAKIEKEASDGNWQAAAWKLERRYPKDYGRQIYQHDHEGGVNIQFTWSDGDDSAEETA